MNTLGIFVKAPEPGRVKTRLGKSLSLEMAAKIYEAFLKDVIDRFRFTADQRYLGYAPDETPAREFFKTVGGGYDLWTQPDVALGTRMQTFFEMAFANQAERVVLIGSDSPTLPVSLINEAFELLHDHDIVIGPATDGGYYLIGQSRSVKDCFQNIDWSTESVLDQTVRQLQQQQLTLGLLPPWYDIDFGEDLEVLRGHYAALQLSGSDVLLSQTAKVLGWSL